MQYKIPQNVQVADKIVGPLTLKQLIIVAVGGGIDYMLYLSLSKVYILTVWVFPVAIIGIITLAVAFLKIKGLPFLKYALYSLEYYFKPRKRLWTAGGGEVFISVTTPAPKLKNDKKRNTQNTKKDLSQVQELSKVLNMHTS